MNKIIYKKYIEEEALDLAKKRYKNMEGKFPFTLAQLERNPDFQKTFNNMKKKSYPDWVIYMAIVNLIINYKINYFIAKPNTLEEHYELWKGYMSKVETKEDIIVPVKVFTEKELEFAIDLFVMSFLKGQGYEFRRATPNFQKMRKYAEENYKVFKFDVPHKKWFKFQNNQKKGLT